MAIKKSLTILFIALAVSSTTKPAAAFISFEPEAPQVMGTEIEITCSVGDYFLQWNPSGVFDGGTNCPGVALIFNPPVETGNYVFAECDSSVPTSNCAGSFATIEEFELDDGYVSQTDYLFVEPAQDDPLSYTMILLFAGIIFPLLLIIFIINLMRKEF